jgi:YebC/PmpR family DNA-binding regulatory protein
MAGHSKWHNIKLRKQAVDQQKAKIFAKASREIIVAARSGGGDPAMNPRLRLALEKAREAGMPNDNIQRAIKRGTGEIEGGDIEELVYEGYGPGGVALLIESQTDNRNRARSDIRAVLNKYGGNMGEPGCVAWLFQRKGIIVVDPQDLSEDDLMLLAADAGAEDITPQDGTFEITTTYEDLDKVRVELQQNGVHLLSVEPAMIPSTTVPLDDERARQMMKMMQALEELDDVQRVNANFDIPDSILLEEQAA